MSAATVPHISVISSASIDRQRWDAVIQSDPRGLIYSRDWVLDHLAQEWEGLIVNDYQAVMALPKKKKLGLKFLATPPFAQRLGLIGQFNDDTVRAVGEFLLQKEKLIQYASADVLLFDTESKKRRTNFILPLQESYDQISAHYTPHCKRNLSKATKRGCELTEEVTVKDVIKLYKEIYGSLSAYTDAHFLVLEQLLDAAVRRNSCVVAGVRNKENGNLVYTGLLLDDGRRIYYLLGAPTREGRDLRATYFFLDSMIRRFQGSRAIFDFEGSNIPDVATFYQSFGPQTEYYYDFYINNLAFPLKKLIDLKLKP